MRASIPDCTPESIALRPHERILVVEDDASLADVVQRVVLSIDPSIRVDRASDFQEARRKVLSENYSLVLADYQLDGRGTGLALRSWCQGRGLETPFAMMSAFCIRDDLDRASASTVPFLPKPFSTAKLRDFLKRAMAPAEG